MGKTAANLLSDLLTVSIRWLSLLGLALYIAWVGSAGLDELVLLGVAVGWNVFLLLLNLFQRRLPYHPYVAVVGDAIFGLLIFLLADAGGGHVIGWAGLMPVLTAALYFGLVGGLISAAGMTVLMVGLLFAVVPVFGYVFEVLIVPILAFFGVGAGGGFLAGWLGKVLRDQFMQEATKKEAKEKLDRDRLEAIYTITATLTSTLDYKRVLDLALDVGATALSDSEESAAGLISAFFLVDEERLILGTGRGLTHADLKVTLPAKSGVVIRVLETGDPRLVNDPESDPELRRIVALHGCHAVYVYPLRTGQEIYGVLLFGHPLKGYFDDVRLEILEIVGRQSLVALQNASLYRELATEKTRMIEIQEEAQQKLARDLHDGPTQSVAAIAMRVNFARRLIERDLKGASDELFKIEELARRTTKEIRHMLFTLRPLVLESSGLVAALQSMADKMKETYEQEVLIEASPDVIEELEVGKQGVAFYIAEEAVNNARKHAEAQVIVVRLQPASMLDVLTLEIQDNGVGFDVGAVDAGYENRGSLGMVNMRERTEMLHGRLRLDSAVGKGTRVRVWIPLNEDAALKLRQAQNL